MNTPFFSKVLIANRGEVALRIVRALHDLGIASVAVYADDDAASPHVGAATQAVARGATGPAAYLDGARVIVVAEMDKALQFPGVANSWTMPIKARIDMLSTGIRTPIGIKVFGKDLVEMERLAKEIEAVIKEQSTWGYIRIWAHLRRKARAEGCAPANRKRIYRIMKVHGLLLQRHAGGGFIGCDK